MSNNIFRWIFCITAAVCMMVAGCNLSFKGEKIDIDIEKESLKPPARPSNFHIQQEELALDIIWIA